MPEEWKPIPSCPKYEASSEGRIRNAKTGVVRKTHFCGRHGYPMVGLQVAGKQKTAKVHRLVCEAFHGPAPVGRNDVAHADGSRTNNRPDNLRWASRAENMADAIGHGRLDGLAKGICGSGNRNAKLTEDDVRAIRAAPRRRGVLYELAARYGVSRNVVGNIRANTKVYWSHVK